MTTNEQHAPRKTDPSTASTRVLAIVGPTAVGKTAVAEAVAVRIGGEIVSADSMQVYRGMDIGTAKPPVAQRAVPYHCLDLVDPGEPYSAALYQHAAREAISDIVARGLVPLMVGGTGLYVRSALDPMEFPGGDKRAKRARADYEALAAEKGGPAVHAILKARDPESAALIHVNNTRRVIRALEMLDSDVSYARQIRGFSERRSIYDARFIGLTMDRGELYERIDARVDAMMATGLVQEVERLLAAGFRNALTAQQAIGYKELVFVLERDADLGCAVDDIKKASRRYAKRQLTWFRADPRVEWIDVTGLSAADVADRVIETTASQTPE